MQTRWFQTDVKKHVFEDNLLNVVVNDLIFFFTRPPQQDIYFSNTKLHNAVRKYRPKWTLQIDGRFLFVCLCIFCMRL